MSSICKSCGVYPGCDWCWHDGKGAIEEGLGEALERQPRSPILGQVEVCVARMIRSYRRLPEYNFGRVTFQVWSSKNQPCFRQSTFLDISSTADNCRPNSRTDILSTAQYGTRDPKPCFPNSSNSSSRDSDCKHGTASVCIAKSMVPAGDCEWILRVSF